MTANAAMIRRSTCSLAIAAGPALRSAPGRRATHGPDLVARGLVTRASPPPRQACRSPRPPICTSFSLPLCLYSTSVQHGRLAYLEPYKAATGDSPPGITLLTLNRPEAKNALSRHMLDELYGAVEQVAFDKTTRVLVLRSLVPKTFCAGADLKERRHMSPVEVDRFLADLRRTFTAIERLPMPTIAALDGLAMGGGLELALCADLRVAAKDAQKIGLPETRLGIIPGAGGTHRMTKLIGAAKTKELVFSARLLSAPEAHELGIIDRLASASASTDTQLSAAAQESVRLATMMASNGPVALRAAKAAIDRGQSLDTETALDWERACYERCLSTKDRLEGLKAFAEKRAPQYTGE